MVKTSSTMLPLGSICPEFELDVVSGTGMSLEGDDFYRESKRIRSNYFSQKPLLIMIICAHCPFVKHIEKGISDLFLDYGQNVQFLAVSSNSLITHPEDGPEKLAIQAKKLGWEFPYLVDSDQTLAKALRGACTPDFYLFSPSIDGAQILRYRGQFDDSTPGNQLAVTGKTLRSALEIILDGNKVSIIQKPSIGCNIKWHPGKEPYWFG